MGIYDAFTTRKAAKSAMEDVGSIYGKGMVRKLKGKQRLQYGVYFTKY